MYLLIGRSSQIGSWLLSRPRPVRVTIAMPIHAVLLRMRRRGHIGVLVLPSLGARRLRHHRVRRHGSDIDLRSLDRALADELNPNNERSRPQQYKLASSSLTTTLPSSYISNPIDMMC